jgi:hypothetical protein
MANRHSFRPPSGHHQTLAPPPKTFFPAAFRIPSHAHTLLCGCSVTYQRCLCASIRQLSASMRQLCASIRRGPETDPARYAARPGPSARAPAEKRQIEHLKIPQKCTFRPKTAPKKFGSGFITLPQKCSTPRQEMVCYLVVERKGGWIIGPVRPRTGLQPARVWVSRSLIRWAAGPGPGRRRPPGRGPPACPGARRSTWRPSARLVSGDLRFLESQKNYLAPDKISFSTSCKCSNIAW